MEDLFAVRRRQGLDLAQLPPQPGIGPTRRHLDGLVADQRVDGHPEDPGQRREVVGGCLLGVGLVVGDHPLGDADGLAELLLAEAAGFTEAAQPGPEGLGAGRERSVIPIGISSDGAHPAVAGIVRAASAVTAVLDRLMRSGGQVCAAPRQAVRVLRCLRTSARPFP